MTCIPHRSAQNVKVEHHATMSLTIGHYESLLYTVYSGNILSTKRILSPPLLTLRCLLYCVATTSCKTEVTPQQITAWARPHVTSRHFLNDTVTSLIRLIIFPAMRWNFMSFPLFIYITLSKCNYISKLFYYYRGSRRKDYLPTSSVNKLEFYKFTMWMYDSVKLYYTLKLDNSSPLNVSPIKYNVVSG